MSRVKHPASMTAAERDACRWRPKGWSAVRLNDGNSVVFYGENSSGRPAAIAYRGKAINPAWHCFFSAPQQRAAHVQRFIGSVTAENQRRAERARERKSAGHSLKVGDILSTCWGYEQTNREYYQVTRVSEKSVWVRRVASHREESDFMSGYSVPVPNRFISDETGPHRARGESATCGYGGADKVPVVEVGGVKSYAPQYWSAHA